MHFEQGQIYDRSTYVLADIASATVHRNFGAGGAGLPDDGDWMRLQAS